ncbi:MAG: replicative DNA helicase [Sumerlaeia bacterium]
MTTTQTRGAHTAPPGLLNPPNNIEVERLLLGCCLLDNEVIADVLNIVTATDFYDPRNAVIFTALTRVFDARGIVNLAMLDNALKQVGQSEQTGGPLYLASLEMGVVGSDAAPELAQIVWQHSLRRGLIKAAQEIAQIAAHNDDATEALDESMALLFGLERESSLASWKDWRSNLTDTIQSMRRVLEDGADGRSSGIQTGYHSLDRLLGGLGWLTILAARPSIGKTTFALNVISRMARGVTRPTGVANPAAAVPVAFFSLEMDRLTITQRMVGLTGPNAMNIHSFRSSPDEGALLQFEAKARETDGWPVYIDDRSGLSLAKVRAAARRIKQRVPNLGAIVIDYLQLMNDPSVARMGSRQIEVGSIARGLKALGRELETPIIALSQLSRQIEARSGKDKDARPQLADLRESGEIEQEADQVIFLHRERFRKTPEGRIITPRVVLTEVIVGKNRNGPIGSVEAAFSPNTGVFADHQSSIAEARLEANNATGGMPDGQDGELH